MDIFLAEVPWKTSVVYLEDIIIFCYSWKENLQHVEKVLQAFQEAGVQLKLHTFEFFLKHIKVPGSHS